MEIYVNVVNYCKAKKHIDGIFHKMFYTAFFELLKKKIWEIANELELSVDVPSPLHWDIFFELLINLTFRAGFQELTSLHCYIIPLQIREMSTRDLLTKPTTDIIYLTWDQFIKLGNILAAVKSRHLIQSRLLKMQRLTYIFKML